MNYFIFEIDIYSKFKRKKCVVRWSIYSIVMPNLFQFLTLNHRIYSDIIIIENKKIYSSELYMFSVFEIIFVQKKLDQQGPKL